MQKAYLTEELGELNCSGGQKPCPIYGNGHASGVITPGSIRGSVPRFEGCVPAFAGMPEKTAVTGSLPDSPSRMAKWTTFLGNSYNCPSAVRGSLFISPIDFPADSEFSQDSSSQKCRPG
jgi:hypothetical protein